MRIKAPKNEDCVLCDCTETPLSQLVVPTSCVHALCEKCAVQRVWTMRDAGNTNCYVCSERIRELTSLKTLKAIKGLDQQDGCVRVRFCSIVWTLHVPSGTHVEVSCHILSIHLASRAAMYFLHEQELVICVLPSSLVNKSFRPHIVNH
jgi:hypothetical protein